MPDKHHDFCILVLKIGAPELHASSICMRAEFLTEELNSDGTICMLTGPTRQGGVLQWGDVEGDIGRPDLPPGVVTLQEAWLPPDEDADAAPSTEVSPPHSSTHHKHPCPACHEIFKVAPLTDHLRP